MSLLASARNEHQLPLLRMGSTAEQLIFCSRFNFQIPKLESGNRCLNLAGKGEWTDIALVLVDHIYLRGLGFNVCYLNSSTSHLLQCSNLRYDPKPMVPRLLLINFHT